jgi:hypothetical protein
MFDRPLSRPALKRNNPMRARARPKATSSPCRSFARQRKMIRRRRKESGRTAWAEDRAVGQSGVEEGRDELPWTMHRRLRRLPPA